MTDIPVVAERQEICPFTLYPPFIMIVTFCDHFPSLYELLVFHEDMPDCPQEFCVPVLFVGLAPNSVVQKKIQRASQVVLVVKNPPANAGELRDLSSIPELGRSPGGKKWHLTPIFLPINPMDKGTWQATVHGAAKIHIRLSTLKKKKDSRWEGGIGSVVC